jgi:hypothetical protein
VIFESQLTVKTLKEKVVAYFKPASQQSLEGTEKRLRDSFVDIISAYT